MKRALIKTLYKIIEYLYTGKSKGEVECINWRINDHHHRWELTYKDNKYKSKCSIIFDTDEVS